MCGGAGGPSLAPPTLMENVMNTSKCACGVGHQLQILSCASGFYIGVDCVTCGRWSVSANFGWNLEQAEAALDKMQ